MLPDKLWTLTPELAGLQATPYENALRCMAQSIRLDRLFHSRLHGAGHISRVMVLGALLAQRAQLDENVTQLLMYACAYHDVGRVDDSVDDEHGLRAALQVEELTGLAGQPLLGGAKTFGDGLEQGGLLGGQDLYHGRPPVESRPDGWCPTPMLSSRASQVVIPGVLALLAGAAAAAPQVPCTATEAGSIEIDGMLDD